MNLVPNIQKVLGLVELHFKLDWHDDPVSQEPLFTSLAFEWVLVGTCHPISKDIGDSVLDPSIYQNCDKISKIPSQMPSRKTRLTEEAEHVYPSNPVSRPQINGQSMID